MATITVATPDTTVPRGPLSARFSTPQVWGFVLLAPYVLVFIAFVLYPVGYGLWLARHPASYVHLVDDPIFARAAVNTLIFLLVGINLKMLLALLLSQTAFAQTLTQKQSEAVREHLMKNAAHRTGFWWWNTRPVRAVGCGNAPPTQPELESLPPSRIEVVLFLPVD